MAEGGLDLGKKAGPLPIGAWIAVVGGGLAIGWYFNKKNSTPQSSLVAETGVGMGPGGRFAPVDPTDGAPPAEEETNETWRKKVTNYLIAYGYPATVADEAVRKYLTGQLLSVQEKAMINDALVKFGVPPEGISGPPNEPPKPPAAVVGLGVVMAPHPTKHLAVVSWLPSTDAVEYFVEESDAKETADKQNEARVTVPPVTMQISGDVQATFTVRAINDNGESPPRSVTVYSGAPKTGGGPVPPPPAPPPPPPPPAARTYVVRGGDILTEISLAQYGTASRWMGIYNANAGAIEGAARAHGRSSSRGGPVQQVGWYIYPGTTLTIP